MVGAYLCFSRPKSSAVLFIYPEQPPAEKIAVCFQVCPVNLAKYTHTTASPAPAPPRPAPGTAHPILLCSLQKPLPGSTPLKGLLPSGEGALSRITLAKNAAQEQRQEWSVPCSLSPPPWNDCSWTVNALCLHGDKACLLQSAPELKISCDCQPFTSGKFQGGNQA